MIKRDVTSAHRGRHASSALSALAAGLVLAATAGTGQAASDEAPYTRDPAATLYGLADGIDGQRIGWYFDDLTTAFQTAFDLQLPLVAVVGRDDCAWCWTYLDQGLTCPSVNRFAGYAVFAYINPERDPAGSQALERLGIVNVPTMTVIRPDAEELIELYRIAGYFTGDALAGYLADALATSGYAVPSAVPGVYGSTVRLSQTPVNPATCAGDAGTAQ